MLNDQTAALESPRTSRLSERLWRLRKLHQQVDAELRDDETGAVEVRFLYKGAIVYRQRWSSRALAVAEAAKKRVELERAGWNSHW